MSEARARGICDNPDCDKSVDWPDNVDASYCSTECAIEARSGGGLPDSDRVD